jgi:hypothetical protein
MDIVSYNYHFIESLVYYFERSAIPANFFLRNLIEKINTEIDLAFI